MKLDNQTIYSTRDLKKIFTRIAQQELDPAKAKRVKFRIVYSKKGGHTGYAYYHGTLSLIRLPKPPHPLDKPNMAMLIAHEMGHLRGLHHGADMDCARYSWKHDYRTFYAWANEYPVAIKQPVVARPKAKNEVLAAKLERTQKMLAKNLAKLRRTEVLVKKWRTKVRYYEKKVDTSTLTRVAVG